ncbi:MAG: hypothetical protein IIZ41_07370 [Lachnospiraceae bacterium]|jgi:uncharacterized membrane protein|nr:hypothetical protein [Lachnospiraceae bacterium]MBQ6637875.1 hypothetical protein [Lachnospiraceae bacterium]MBR3636599.1 hypothetical protein [Lachnospiraceae bacterium]
MTKKATDIWAYIGWPGFIVAMCQPCKDECKFHLNQALVLNIFASGVALFTAIPFVGWILGSALDIAIFVLWLITFIGACKQEEKETPLLGKINIMNK